MAIPLELTRKRFLFLCDREASGLWLIPTGLVRLSRALVLQAASRCTFCGAGSQEVKAMAGTIGVATRICDGCLDYCVEHLAEEEDSSTNISLETRVPDSLPPGKDPTEEVARLLAQIGGRSRSDSSANALALRAALDGPVRPPPPLACAFCARNQHVARRLFSGETEVFVCDECVCDEVGLLQLALEAAEES